MTFTNTRIGIHGETIAANYLLLKGYSIIAKNFRTKSGEIDIIALNNNVYAFVEVKCRIGNAKGMPYEAVNRSKLHKIMTAAQYYVLQNKLEAYKLSIHVISIVLNEDLTVVTMKHFEDVQL